MNLAQMLSGTAARHPQATAFKLDGLTVDYAFTEQAAMRVATMLKGCGVGPGDRVAMMIPNVPHFAFCYYGILRLGATVVPLNVLSKQREIDYFLSDSGAKALFAWDDFLPEAKAAATDIGRVCLPVRAGEFEHALLRTEPTVEFKARAADDTAVILYSSGTTGTPKGAELTHANMVRNAEISGELFAFEPGSVLLGALPLFHAFGQTCALNAAIISGAALSLLPRFDPEKALQIIARDRIAVFEGVPTMYAAMLNVPDRQRFDTSGLEICVSGGAAMPAGLMRQFEAAFDCQILEGYGLSESSPVASFNHPDRERKLGSIGQPVEGVEMKVVDDDDHDLGPGEVGEIVIRGHNVMKGYLGRPEETELALRGGWLHTGDLGRVDEDGYFYIVDRKKDMIIRGGFNVYPREVEEVLYAHPAVREAAVIGVPDGHYGEEVAAAVALKPGTDVTPEQLQEFVKEQVAAYKYPRHVWLMDELPKGPTGKILKRAIRAGAGSGAGASGGAAPPSSAGAGASGGASRPAA